MESYNKKPICKYYNTPYGCKFGNKCHFAHIKKNQNDETEKNQICSFYIKGYCKFGKSCKFLHQKDKKTDIIPKNTFINIKTIDKKKLFHWVCNIIILKDGRLSASLYEYEKFQKVGHIVIFDKINYSIEVSIFLKGNKNCYDPTYYHFQLKNENIAACLGNRLIIVKINKDNTYTVLHDIGKVSYNISKAIELKNNSIMYSSVDRKIQVWEYDSIDLEYKYVKTYEIGKEAKQYIYFCNIMLFGEEKNKLVATCTELEKVIFYEVENDINLNKIVTYEGKAVESNWNSMIEYQNKILLISGWDTGIFLFDSKCFDFICYFEGVRYAKSYLLLENGNLLIASYQDKEKGHSLVEFKLENNKFIKIKDKEKAHKFPIYGLLLGNDGIIFSCSSDATVKLWKST